MIVLGTEWRNMTVGGAGKGWTRTVPRSVVAHKEIEETQAGKESGWEVRQIPFPPIQPTLGVRPPRTRQWCSATKQVRTIRCSGENDTMQQ